MYNLLKEKLRQYWPRGTKNTHFNNYVQCLARQSCFFDPIIFSLESPKFHQFKIYGTNLFEGWAFFFGPKVVEKLNVYFDARIVGSVPVNIIREDVSVHVPSILAAKNCGFSIKLNCPGDVKTISFETVFSDGEIEPFFDYDVAYIIENQDEIDNWSKRLNNLNMPDKETVFLTQGHYNVEEYRNSILPAVMNIRDYLSKSGVNINDFRDILDFGCGSGRILKGWHCVRPELDLHGCDYNQALIDWNKDNLPENISVLKNRLNPPLTYPDNSFNLICMVSVFTHLTLGSQKSWIEEFERILRPGGILLVTLQGEFYVRNVFYDYPEMIQDFFDAGYATTDTGSAEGGNQFGAFHAYSFVIDLFKGFDLIGFFPQGNLSDKRKIFQIALAQDVYVLRYRRK